MNGVKLKVKLQTKPFNERQGKAWKTCLPFVDNSRAILIHRPRMVTTYDTQKKPHQAIENWCGSTQSGTDKFTFSHTIIDGDKLLCARCENNAVEAGLPSADAIVGRHVHVGRVVPIQACCNADVNHIGDTNKMVVKNV